MTFEELLNNVKILYAIPYNDNPIVYALPVKSVNKKFYLGVNKYIIELILPSGELKYINLHDKYINNLNGDNISIPFIDELSKYPEWNLDSANDDHTKYLIYNDRDKLIDEYINQLKYKIKYDQETIDNLYNEIKENNKRIDFIKKQKYEK